MINESNNALKIGRQAFAAFVKAVETGDAEDLLELMTDDVRFLVPIPFEEWRGEQIGRERVGELIRFERDTMQLRIKFEQTAIAATGNLVAIEFRVAGENKGGAYQNHLAIFFEIEDGKVKSWREYGGDINPKAVAALNQK
ncbi:MAG: nuclear transport factor 2 family protein [Pyrinomonadaceae bacterium]|nr:nuclear transport factor 2 family protein [Pyrinomonadaceae bacterium]